MRSDFQMGAWRVAPHQDRLIRLDHPEHEVKIDPKAMQVLVFLAERPGELHRRGW